MDLLTSDDVADLLGVSRRRVNRLATVRADFPAPAVVLAQNRKLWARAGVEALERLGGPDARRAARQPE